MASNTSRSSVWTSFEKVSQDEVKCMLCEKRLKYNGSTTSPMRTHLLRIHPQSSSGEDSKTPIVVKKEAAAMHNFLSRNTISDARKRQITSKIVEWCTGSLRPLSVVSDPGLIGLFNFLEPGYDVPSRTNIAAIIRLQHDTLKTEMIAVLAEADGVAVTFDHWTSARCISYATYSGHFIDKDWVIRTFAMEVSECAERHTANNICQAAVQVLQRCGVKLCHFVGVVTDEAANMVAATRQLSEQNVAPRLYGVVCACHRLQTAIRHALNLPEVQELLAKCRKLVGHFKKSTVASRALRQCQATGGTARPLALISENATRWNSTFSMLERLSQLRAPINVVLNDPATKPAGQALNLHATEWNNVKEVSELLKPFRELTNDLSAVKNVTISGVLPQVFGLLDECEIKESDTAFLADLKATLGEEITSKFHLTSINSQSCEAVSCALDPRFKSLLFLPDADRMAVYAHIKHVLQMDGEPQPTHPQVEPEASPDTGEPVAKRPCPSADRKPELKKTPSLLKHLAGSRVSASKPVTTPARPSLVEQFERYLQMEGCDVDDDPLAW